MRRTSIAALSAAALLLAACGNGNGEADPDPENGEAVDENGEADGDTVTVAIAGEEPYSYLDEGGEPTGAAIAIAEDILGDRMGYQVEAELTDWDSLIPGLNAGNWDVVSAGMSITPERCAEADFSEPELMYTTALLVEEGNPHDVHDLEDVAAAQEAGEDIDIVTLTAGVEAGFSDGLGIDYEGVGSAEDGVDFVTGGRADVFALTAISLNAMAAELDGVEVTDAFVHEVGAGSTVFPQGDAELLDEYNEHLAEIKESGEFLELIEAHGFTEAEVPPLEMTADELCEGDIEALNEQYLDD